MGGGGLGGRQGESPRVRSQAEVEKKWAGRRLSELTRAEKSALVADLGFERFRALVEREYLP
jgi:hypothetical protein